jgi:hypothetical protein
MFNYRNNAVNAYSIKIGSTGKIRLFFTILNHPWAALQAIIEFKADQEKLEENLVSLQIKLAEEKLANTKLREEIYELKKGKA